MFYAQLNYKQFVGNSHLGLNEIGCFVSADSNLLEKVGKGIDPPTLNNFYESHNLYTYDLTDRANDDITWSTVTHYCPQLVVNQIGGAGFPNSDLAQVEFRYRDHAGQEINHFCAVNSASDHSIIDSWDGKVKTPAEYEHVYGQPIAWATFTFHTVETIPVHTIPNTPVSAPAAHTASIGTPPPSSAHVLFLPPSVSVWHVYNPSGPWTLPHATHILDPKMFGGLTYQILGSPAPNVYLIKTQDFGEVAIYAGPDTVAQFPGIGHGEGERTDSPAPQDSGVLVSEVVPAPTVASVATAEPIAEPPAPPPAVIYTRFDAPIKLVTKDGARSVNFESGTVVDNFTAGTHFEAVGKAVLANNDTYYMDNNNFGTADQTQHTPITVGIKTVDLSLAPEITPAPMAGSGITTPLAVPSGTQNISMNSPAADMGASTATLPPAPPTDVPGLPWQRMTFFMNPQTYLVKEDMKAIDFETGNKVEVRANTLVVVGGTFLFGGSKFYRSQKSIEKKTWYGFPVTSLIKQDATNTPFNTGDDIDQLGYEAEHEISKSKQAIIKTAGTTHGWMSRLNIRRG